MCGRFRAPHPDAERAMSVVVPMTTEIRGGDCEIPFPKPAWLKQASVVNALGIAGVDNAKIIRRLAAFPRDHFAKIETVCARMLGLAA